MNLFFFAIKNILYNPAKSILTILLISLSTGILLTTYIVQEQYSKHLAKNSFNIDCVMSAKGSPLQSVLAHVYHVDYSTGNINISDIKPFLNKNHPVIAESLPISMGDNMKGYSIIGVTPEFIAFYQLKLASGHVFYKNTEVVAGYNVAKNLALNIGDTFKTSHGLVESDEHNHELNFELSGILEKQNTIIDQLLFVPISAYWEIHHQEARLTDHVLSNDSLVNYDNEISALLIRYKNKNIQSLNFIRNVNENTSIMAASPAIEVNRLYELTGSISDLLNTIGIFIALISLVSILFNLFQALQDRKFELALMRLQGGKQIHLFASVFFEGLIIVTLGLMTGFLFSHSSLATYSYYSGIQNKFGIKGNEIVQGEITLGLFFLMSGAIFSIVPAIKAYKTDILKTLRSK